MQDRKIESGDTIYREGDEADAVHFITSGRVEVRREAGDENVLLSILEKGQFFGEIGVVQNRPRSTTTTALSDITLASIPKDDFLKAFGDTNAFALPLLRTLCDRLRRAEHLLIDHINPEIARAIDVSSIVLRPDSPEMELQIGTDGIVVEKLPFIVGRRSKQDDPPHALPSALLVRPHDMFRIDLEHFAILKHDGNIFVRDLESHLGTVVNGQRLATFEQSPMTQLGLGMNMVEAGGADSPYRFCIMVEKA